MTVDELVEKTASVIAEELGDDIAHAFANKSEWIDARGEKGGRFRDINEPMRGDYTQAARSAILAVLEGIREPTQAMDQAGWDATTPPDCDPDRSNVAEVYTAMIDALRASVEKEDV